MSASVPATCRYLLAAPGALSISKLAELMHESVAEVSRMVTRMHDSGLLRAVDSGWLIADEVRARTLARGAPSEGDVAHVHTLCANCGARADFVISWRRSRE